MRYGTPGLFFFLLLFQPGHIAVILRCKANLFFKECAERTQAFETYFAAYFSHLFVFGKQGFGLFNALERDILVWRPFIHLGEQAVKMKAREKGFLRDHIQADRLLVIIVNKYFGVYNAFV